MMNELFEKTVKQLQYSEKFMNETIAFMSLNSLNKLKRLLLLTMRDKTIVFNKNLDISKREMKQRIKNCKSQLDLEYMLHYQWFRELALLMIENTQRIVECNEI